MTQASSSVVIHWTPKPGYRFVFDFYDNEDEWIRDTGWYYYDSTSAENGNRLVYVDPLKYPTFTIRQRQEAYRTITTSRSIMFISKTSLSARTPKHRSSEA